MTKIRQIALAYPLAAAHHQQISRGITDYAERHGGWTFAGSPETHVMSVLDLKGWPRKGALSYNQIERNGYVFDRKPREQVMPYHGHIRNGIVDPDQVFPWPDGTEVVVDLPLCRDGETTSTQGLTLYDRLESFIGAADGLPADLAENHDHYLHGRPKR